jgi:hypothetical protein
MLGSRQKFLVPPSREKLVAHMYDLYEQRHVCLQQLSLIDVEINVKCGEKVLVEAELQWYLNSSSGDDWTGHFARVLVHHTRSLHMLQSINDLKNDNLQLLLFIDQEMQGVRDLQQQESTSKTDGAGGSEGGLKRTKAGGADTDGAAAAKVDSRERADNVGAGDSDDYA